MYSALFLGWLGEPERKGDPPRRHVFFIRRWPIRKKYSTAQKAKKTSNVWSFTVLKRYASSLTDSVKVKFSRSSGPGGQNVNKLATKAEVRLKVEEAEWMSTEVKQSLIEQQKNRINNRKELIVTSDRFRSQSRNLQDAMQKLKEMIKAASTQSNEPSQEKIDRILEYVEKENERRLLEKKYHSEKKKSRTKL